jgi:cytochrome P450
MTATTTVPGPRGSWLLGMTREIRRDPLGTYESVMRANRVVGRIPLGLPGRRVEMYLVSHPDGVQQVLAGSERELTKGSPIYREIAAAVGNGLLTSDGPTWRQQRRTLAPLFTPRRIATYAAAMAEEAAKVAARWALAAEAGSRTPQAAPPQATLDLHAEMTGYALRVVARILFGTDVDAAVPAVREMFPVVSEYVRYRAFSPVKPPASWPTRRHRRAAAAQTALYRVVDDVIDQRRRAAGGGGAAGGDLISLLLTARDPETGDPLTATEVRDQTLIFLLAGHETTATALTFALHLLGHHPQVQDRVRREVADVLGDRTPTAADLAALPYTDQVLREAMRLYPPAFSFGRIAPRGATVAGYDIPAGGLVAVSPWATHRHPDFWPEPDRFDPARFEPAAVAARHKYAYLPFSGGARNCIGNHFAVMEAVAAIALLVRAVRLETDGSPVPMGTGITARPAVPVPARLRPVAVPRETLTS